MNINELLEPNAKKAVFTFGRFNPPTKGHARLMDVVKNAASGADHYVFTGKTNDPKKNPLEYKDKITFLRAMFPHMNIMDDPKIRTPWEALEELGKQYDEVTMVVGSDRQPEFEKQMRPYIKDFGIQKFNVISSGERDADATDVAGISASKARAFARAGDYDSFAKTIDGGDKLKQQLYHKVRQGMGVTEASNKPKQPKKPVIKSRDPNWRDMEAIRQSGAAGSHKDKKALDKRGYAKHKSKSFDIDEEPATYPFYNTSEGKPIAYVDMDGVLANFFAEYAKLAGVETGNYRDIPPAKTDPTLDKMIGTDFFNRLPKFPTTDKLIQMVVKEFGSYKILSSPLRGDHENSKEQKIKWIKRELAIQPDEIIVVGRKDSYAVQPDGTQNILIDDRGKNIQGWLSRGGYGIKYQADEDPLSKVQQGIKDFKEKNNLTEWGGRVVKGINTTPDVGVDAIKKQSAKFGFKVTKDGVPPILAPKNLRRVKRMKEALIKINGANKDLTLQQQMDLLEVKKGINKMLKATREVPTEVPYQNNGGDMSLLTHPGTAMFQKMKLMSKPGTDDWFKTWRTLSYLTKGRKNHYMLPVKEQLERLLIKHGVIQEASGMFNRKPGKDFFTHKDGRTATLQSITAYPDQGSFETPEQRDETIKNVQQQIATDIDFFNKPTNSLLAFSVALLQDEQGQKYAWGLYHKESKVGSLKASWKNNQIPQGWMLSSVKASTKTTATPISPQDLIRTNQIFQNAQQIARVVEQNFQGDDALKQTLLDGVSQATQSDKVSFPGQGENETAIRDYFAEILQPISLQAGHIKGEADKAKELINNQEWKVCRFFYPMDKTNRLIDSYMVAPDGTRVGLSSKGGEGAKASARNLYDTIERLATSPKPQDKELLENVPYARDVLEKIHNNDQYAGPLLLAQEYNLIDQEIVDDIKKLGGKGKHSINSLQTLSPKTQEFWNNTRPIARELEKVDLFISLITKVAYVVTVKVNSNPDFSKQAMKLLNNASIIQVYTQGAKDKQGNMNITGYRTVYPPRFEGTLFLDATKNYANNKIIGKMAFGLK